MRFFFYGTLMDPDVRRAVLRDDAGASCAVEPARLSDWRRAGLRGASYPIIVPAAGAHVDGVLARGLDAGAVRRLCAYEGDEYTIATVDVGVRGKLIAANVFVPGKRYQARAQGAWDLATWQRRFKRRWLADLTATPVTPGAASLDRAGASSRLG